MIVRRHIMECLFYGYGFQLFTASISPALVQMKFGRCTTCRQGHHYVDFVDTTRGIRVNSLPHLGPFVLVSQQETPANFLRDLSVANMINCQDIYRFYRPQMTARSRTITKTLVRAHRRAHPQQAQKRAHSGTRR